MAALRSGRWVPWAWLTLLCGLAFWYRLGSTGLLDETEPLFAEAARQMTVTGDWITPYFNGVTRFDKPPLIYWLMALGYHLVGVNSWGARIPSALTGTLLVGAVFWVCDRLVRSTASDPDLAPEARYSRALPYLITAPLALNLQMIFFGRTGYSDMLLNLCFGGSLLSFFAGYTATDRRSRVWGYLGFWILMALGVLTKGPVGLVLPGGIVLAFLLVTRQLKNVLREMPWRWGAILFAAIALPWYGLAYWVNGEVFIDAFFGFHNLERFTQVVNHHSGPWYYHFVMVLVGFAPWSLAIPAAIGAVWAQRPWKNPDRRQQLGLLAGIWFVLELGFFTIAQTKYITYSLPSIPAAAILVGLWWSQGQADWVRLGRRWDRLGTTIAIGVVCLALGVASWLCPSWLDEDPSMPGLGTKMAALGLTQTSAVIWVGAAIVTVGCLLWKRSDRVWNVQLSAFVLFVALFILPTLTTIDQERQLPIRQIAEGLPRVQRPQEPLVMAVNTFDKPSLVFYARQDVTFFDRSVKLPPYLKELAQTGKVASVLVMTTPDTLSEAEIPSDRYQVVMEAGVYRLVRFSLRS